MSSLTIPITEIERELEPRARTLAWMASIAIAAGEIRMAEAYLLELIGWCAFADRSIVGFATAG